jgi:hypothetical protein
MATKKPAVIDGPTSKVRRRNFGKNHAYYLTGEDGVERKLDGVTSLLSDGLPKPALINWAGNVTAEYAVDHKDELAAMSPSQMLKVLKGAKYADRDLAAAKGSLVHDIAEHIIAGEEVDVPDDVRGHVESAVKFLDDYQIRPLLTETTVFHTKAMYGGTLDMVVTSDLPQFKDRVILADWKTSRSGIYDEAALQLSAYRNAEFYQDAEGVDHAMSELGITDAWGVWIRSDGYDVYELDTGDEAFKFFQYIATVARRARALKESPLKGQALPRVGAFA